MTRTHAKRTRNAHETSTVTGGATLRSLPVPNPHSSPPPSSLSPPQPALFAVTTSHCSPFRSLPVSITSGSDHFRFRSLPVPNPHCSPTNCTDPRATFRRQPALSAAITSGFDHFRFRSLPVPITSGSHLVLFADPFLIWG